MHNVPLAQRFRLARKYRDRADDLRATRSDDPDTDFILACEASDASDISSELYNSLPDPPDFVKSLHDRSVRSDGAYLDYLAGCIARNPEGIHRHGLATAARNWAMAQSRRARWIRNRPR